MSSKTRGTKRSAEDASSGPKAKFSKPSGAKGGFNKGGQKGGFKGGPKGKFTKGGNGGGFKSGGGGFNKSGGGFNKGGGGFNKGGNGGFKGKGKAAPAQKEREEAPAKRKRPVTQGGGEEDAMSVDDDESGGDEFDLEGDAEMEEGAEGAEGEDGAPEKRGKMTKAEREALHAQQPHRRTLLPSHGLLTDTLLPLWEKARQTEMPKEERKQAISELYEAVKGRVLEISRGHKGGRVLQTIVKYGGKEERTGVAMELEPQWRAMMESKYSKFLMGKLIRYCPSIRPLLIPHISKHLPALIFHAHAIDPISDFYDLWANGAERRMLVRGFYPREVALFDGGKESGDVVGLEGALEATSEAGRARVLEGVEKTVLDIFNATQKTALAQSIFHRLVNEYLTCLYRFLTPEEADTKMHELLAASLESLPEIVHTKDGSAVVRELIVRGSAKDRKQILQQLKKHIEAMAKDADAQLVLFTAFDCVDDTKLMGKAFVSDIVALAPSLLEDKNGRRAVLYLLTPRALKHYMPSTLGSLAASAAQAKALGTSKKETETRRKELVSYASEGLLSLVAEKGAELVADPGSGLVVTEIMLHTSGDKSAAIDALTAPLAAPFSGDGTHVLELPHATRTYKTLLSGGHYNTATKAIEVADPELGAAFASAFWKAISSDDAGGKANAIAVAAAAPFVAVELLAAFPEAAETLRDGKEEIGASEMKGANVLLEKLA